LTLQNNTIMHDLGTWDILWSEYNRQHDKSELLVSRTIKDATWFLFIWR